MLLCWVVVALDGFDLVVLGAVIPVLSKSGDLGFTGSSLTDRFGRRITLISSIALLSVLTLAVAVAQDVT